MPDQNTVAEYLEALARGGPLATYSEAQNHFGLPPFSKDYRWIDSPLYRLFRRIDEQDVAARRPLRTSSIVQKVGKKKTIPNDGYFQFLCRHLDEPMPRGIVEKRKMHTAELRRLREHYGFKEPTAA